MQVREEQHDSENEPEPASQGAPKRRWVAPLHSFKTFSIAEFTQTSASPGDDGSGIFTAS